MDETAALMLGDALPPDRVVAGRAFTAIAARPYVRLDGGSTRLIEWRSTCPRCGDAFTFHLGERVSRFPMHWGCQQHRREVRAMVYRRHPELAPPPKERTPVKLEGEKEQQRLDRAAMVQAIYAADPSLERAFPRGLPDYIIADMADGSASSGPDVAPVGSP